MKGKEYGVIQSDKRTPAHDAKDESMEEDHIGSSMVHRLGTHRHHQSGVLVGHDQGGVPIDGDHEYEGHKGGKE